MKTLGRTAIEPTNGQRAWCMDYTVGMSENLAETSFPLARFFQPDYKTARAHLLQALKPRAQAFDVTIDSRALKEKGALGETLALDFCLIGSRQPKHVLLLSSGTHGVEGYVGSAVQLWVASELLSSVRLGPQTAIVLQHANNPYGFSWSRRVNEGNVDLNRNFLSTYDHTLCDPGYDELYDAVNPAVWSEESEAKCSEAFQAYIDKHGLRGLQQALSAGQYKHPRGVQFGGHAEQQSTKHLKALFSTYLHGCDNLYWLDFHTGLGESAACELITGSLPGSEEYVRSSQIWAQGVKSTLAGESLSAKLNGLMANGLIAELPAHTTRAFAFPEYGTHPPITVMNAMRADNWLFNHGPWQDQQAPITQQIRRQTLEAFRPNSREWEHKVILHAQGIVREALAKLPGVTLL